MSYGHPYTQRITARLSENGGDKEQRHDALWKELYERVEWVLREIANEPKYAEINPELWE
jgi:hypothetical protein